MRPEETTILLVEDEEVVRKFARIVLEGSGYGVLEAPDGQAALDVSRGHGGPIHVLVSDMRMPRMGGKDLAAHLRRERPEVKILFMSGFPGEISLFSDPDRPFPDGGLGEPGAAFLGKPFSPAQLIQAVQGVLGDGAGARPGQGLI